MNEKPGKPFIFVSCGQFTDAEKSLGKSIVKMVKAITGLDAFFAEEVQDLNGLDTNILGALRDCAGFITVMHPRGKIVRPDSSTHIRASVWIEQEIAIGTYIQRVEKRPLPVIAFIHESVGREGIRDLLHLNPISFRDETEILAALPELLTSWKTLTAPGKHRDYDEEHRRLAGRAVNSLSEASKDLVYFLLHRGKTEAEELRRHCQHTPEYDDAVQRARQAGLVVDSQTANPGRSSVTYFWEVNPQFKSVLQDLLGKRDARYFL